MNRFDPYALFFDQPEGGLLKDALVVSRVGVEVLAARSLEEARQILEAEGQRPGALLFSTEMDRSVLPALVHLAETALTGGVRSMVAVGNLGGRSSLRELRNVGVKWLVQTPFTDDELHLGVTQALAEGSWADVRKSHRAPITVPVTLRGPHGCIAGTVQDLSVNGLFFAVSDPPEVGTRLSLELVIGDRTLALSGTVVHLSRRLSPRGEVGFGLCFDPVGEADARTLREFVDAHMGSVRL
jgi:hypothetical protein